MMRFIADLSGGNSVERDGRIPSDQPTSANPTKRYNKLGALKKNNNIILVVGERVHYM